MNKKLPKNYIFSLLYNCKTLWVNSNLTGSEMFIGTIVNILIYY